MVVDILIGPVFFQGLQMTKESKHVAHVSMVVDIPINCYVKTVTFSPCIALLTLRDGKYEVQEVSCLSPCVLHPHLPHASVLNDHPDIS